MLPLETIAGVEMTKRTVWVLEVGIGLSEREVQHDPLGVGKLILAGVKFFQPNQAAIAATAINAAISAYSIAVTPDLSLISCKKSVSNLAILF